MVSDECLNCSVVWHSMDETCWNCGCPYRENMFDDPTGEQQDNALRTWYEGFETDDETLS